MIKNANKIEAFFYSFPWRKFELYIISLGFLFALIGINQIPYCFEEDCKFMGFNALFLKKPPILLFCVSGLVLAFIFYLRFNYTFVKGAALPPESIKSIKKIDYENLTFLSTYIIPLVCFDLDFNLSADKNFLMLILVLLLIGWIYIKTNIFYTNPTLAVLNFKLYLISTETRSEIVVISRAKLHVGDMIRLNRMDDNIFIGSKYY